MDFEYAPAPESAAIAAIKDRYLPFIDGTFVEGGGDDLESINPGTGEHLTTVSTVGPEDLDRAVAAARRAYEQVWGPMPPAERGLYLFRIARGIAERARELAVLETLDNGKPIRETRDFDVPAAAQHFFYHAGWADKLQHLGLGPDPRPLGVAGQVIPWNFPLLMAAWKIAPALAAGNTVVIKPAETTSLSILVLAEIMADVGLPPGVVNVVAGAGDIGSALVNHPGIDKVAFTGSTAVGRRIQRELAGTGRRLTLELGGKGANIVFDDAAQDQAVEGIVNGIFFNAGQVCCAGSRLLVQEPIAEEFVERLKRRMETLRVGDPLDKNTDVGAINSARQHQRISELVQAGVDEGATCWTSSQALPQCGYYVAPTLLTEATASMRVTREEIFGPVLTVLTFRTPDEAVAKANNTPYGLSAGVWTEKGSRAMAMAAALQAGVIWDNTFNRFDPAASFGGYRESGFGREGGPSGLAAYLDSDNEGVLASPRADQHEGVLGSPQTDRREAVLASPHTNQQGAVLASTGAAQSQGALAAQSAQHSQPALTDPRAEHPQPALVTPAGATRRPIDPGDKHNHRALLSTAGGPEDPSAGPAANADAVPGDGNAPANGQREASAESPGRNRTGRTA